MVKRTVLKVDISCHKCKKKLLKAISNLEGVDKIEVDQDKGTLTVTGDVDPYDVIRQARRAGGHADVVSIGPPSSPTKPDKKEKPDKKKKPDEKKKPDKKTPETKTHCQPQCQTDGYCPPHGGAICPQMAYGPIVVWEEPSPSCSIM